MTFEEIEQLVIKWATERQLFSEEHGSNAQRQCAKLDEEFRELCTAVINHDLVNIVDSLGDMMVVMTLIARYIHTDLTTCYHAAYLEIKDRRGKMVNGLFVKEL